MIETRPRDSVAGGVNPGGRKALQRPTRPWKDICLAPTVQHIHRQPGAAPQESWHPGSVSAESAIHFPREFDSPGELTRAFSAFLHGNRYPWGDAPGSDDEAPLALNRFLTIFATWL